MVARRPAAKRGRQPPRRIKAQTPKRSRGATPKRPVAQEGDSPSFDNIEFLIKDGGDITVGRLAAVRCAATAAADWGTLAMLQRREDESLLQLLARLDAAIGAALEDPEQSIDEINAPPQ